MFNQHIELAQHIKREKPLILNLTNDVTMDFIANGLISLGASPMMTKSVEELEDLITISHAMVINIGTLDGDFLKTCDKACELANKHHKPIVLDPVGAGASQYRTKTCQYLLERYQFAVVRGNASEIMALSYADIQTKGVDSLKETCDAVDVGKVLSNQHDVIVGISGQTDAIIEGEHVAFSSKGSDLMPQITGSGCLLTAVIAAFVSVEGAFFKAANSAVHYYGACGELAADKANGPGTFKPLFIDALSALSMEAHHV